MKLEILLNTIDLICWIAILVINIIAYMNTKKDMERWEDIKKEYEKEFEEFKRKY